MAKINEPENRPRERIEQLISKTGKKKDNRVHDRIQVEPGAEVFFPLICKGEVADVSEEGLSIRFKPADVPGLEQDNIIPVTLPTESGSITLNAQIRRVESRFGVIIIGMTFDPESIESEE